MRTTTTTIAHLLRRARRACIRLLEREEGTVLTEFVMTLPVFIILFAGIVELNKIERAANEAHMLANRSMWETTMEVMESEPWSEWADPHRVQNNAPPPPENCEAERYHECAGYDWNKFKRLNDYGSIGEAISGARYAEVQEWLDRFENISRFSEEDEVDLRMYETVYGDQLVWGAYALQATWDRGHTRANLPGAPVGLEAFAHLSNKSPATSRVAYGAGTRYGLVYGDGASSVSTRSGSYSFDVQYQTLAPPRPMETDDEEYYSVGAARLSMKDTGFDRIPGFEYDFELNGFEVDELVE